MNKETQINNIFNGVFKCPLYVQQYNKILQDRGRRLDTAVSNGLKKYL